MGISCLICGIIRSSGYRLRVSELVFFRDMMLSLAREISYRKDPVALSLARIKHRTSGLAAEFIASVISEDISDFQHRWEYAADSVYGDSILTPEDIEILKEAGAELGANGMAQQQSMIEMITAKLDKNIQQADGEYRTKGRMCRAVGGFCGVCAVILLI